LQSKPKNTPKKTSEATGQADILPSAEKRAEYSEITDPNSHSDTGQKQGPMRFGKAMSEPCSFQHPIAITSLLATGSKRSLEKALSKMPDKKLREIFKLEANTHKAMSQRVSAGKAKCVKRWRSLRPFLVDILWELG